MRILISLWLLPGLLLLVFWFLVDLYRVILGSGKNLSAGQKLKTLFPTLWTICFAAMPIFNIILLITSIIKILGSSRASYL